MQWKGLLPATADGVTRYFAEYADTLAVSPLRQRLAALAQWHNAQGFPDPTWLRIEQVEASAGEGISCLLGRSKGDRQNLGTTFQAPALSRLCPVEAYLDWIGAAQLTAGPVYRAIDRWGHVWENGLHIDSIAPLLRTMLKSGGLASAGAYSGHSLRRGFANWAASDGWDVKSLMEYAGWRDIKSALRYLDASVSFAKTRMEHGIVHHIQEVDRT